MRLKIRLKVYGYMTKRNSKKGNPTKDKPPYYGLHPPYAAVCFFPRQAGQTDSGNHLESGEIRGNMLTRQPPLYRTNGEIAFGVLV